jgi:hypothetical protein
MEILCRDRWAPKRLRAHIFVHIAGPVVEARVGAHAPLGRPEEAVRLPSRSY